MIKLKFAENQDAIAIVIFLEELGYKSDEELISAHDDDHLRDAAV